MDAEQLVFELVAFLQAANATSLLQDDAAAYRRARTAVDSRLAAASRSAR